MLDNIILEDGFSPDYPIWVTPWLEGDSECSQKYLAQYTTDPKGFWHQLLAGKSPDCRMMVVDGAHRRTGMLKWAEIQNKRGVKLDKVQLYCNFLRPEISLDEMVCFLFI